MSHKNFEAAYRRYQKRMKRIDEFRRMIDACPDSETAYRAGIVISEKELEERRDRGEDISLFLVRLEDGTFTHYTRKLKKFSDTMINVLFFFVEHEADYASLEAMKKELGRGCMQTINALTRQGLLECPNLDEVGPTKCGWNYIVEKGAEIWREGHQEEDDT